MKILIAGCGDIGTLVGQHFVKHGHQVFGIRRNTSRLPPEIIPIEADLSQLAPLNLPSNIDLLYYTAAAKQRNQETYRQIYVNGLQHTIESCRQNSPELRHIFFTSSTSVYGQIEGQVVTEDSPTEPSTFSGQIMLAGEQILRQYNVPHTAVRCSGIYGPGRTFFIRNLQNGTAFLKQTDTYTNRIHRTDCAGFLVHLASIDKPLTTYIATDSTPTSYNQVISYIAQQLKLPQPQVRSVPIVSNKRCSNQSLLSTGYSLKYPTYRDGYQEMITTMNT